MIRMLKRAKRMLNRLGSRKKCYVCGTTFHAFYKFRGGTRNRPEWIRQMRMVGSDLDNFECPYCRAHDRERHLFMYFDKLDIWQLIPGKTILHFAPERHLRKAIQSRQPSEYVMGDLYPSSDEITKIDVTRIPFEDARFDLVLCNHVLEHIPDHHKALQELHRVLKPGGTAILQTPYSDLLKSSFEDSAINTEELKFGLYGQEDHVRIFSKNDLLSSISDAGFTLASVQHDELFDDRQARYFGVNKHEILLRARK